MGLFKKKDRNYYINEYRRAKNRGDIEESARCLIKAAELGSELGALTLGRCYLYGDLGFEQDYDKAIDWLIKTAKDNVFYIGDDLEFAWKKAGRAGEPPVKSTAVKEQPDTENFYYQESQTARKEGRKWDEMKYLILAARDNNALARNALAKKYTDIHASQYQGKYEKEDFAKADEWFQRAVNIGYISAYCDWGRCLQ